jgi:CMP-N-acetylneuraminic acid synthetase
MRRPSRVVGVIPARGGSKGIPGKNIKACAGKPLLAYTAEAALASRRLDRVILSTDDGRIARVGKKLGLEVPFLRPQSLASDRAPMAGVLQHLLKWLEGEDAAPEMLVLLQPTSPLRTARHIDEAVDLFRENKADTVVSVVPVPHQFTPGSLMKVVAGRLRPLQGGPLRLRRQDKPLLYARNGPAILVTNTRVVRGGALYGKHVLGYEMSPMDSIDVDGPDDLALAAALLKARPRSSRRGQRP